MSEANKALAKRWFEEVWDRARKEAICEMLADDAVLHEAGDEIVGPKGFYPFFERMHAAFSDFHVTAHDAIAEGDQVCLRWSVQMRHTGNFNGIPSANKTVHATGMSLLRISEGKLVEGWQNWDMLGLIQQLRGEPAAPTYAAAKAE